MPRLACGERDIRHAHQLPADSDRPLSTFYRCLGLAIPPTAEIAQLLAITYPKNLLDTFARNSSTEEQQRFRFICLSGALVERDQNKTMWFLENERKLRVSGSSLDGRVEYAGD